MATYLVTGGAGFIGSNLVEALLRRGDDVRALDDFSSGRRSNLGEVDAWAAAGGGRFTLVEGSLCDAATVRAAVSNVEYVLHKGAIPSVQRSVDDPQRTNEANVGGTLNVLQAAREAGVKRVVFASSSSIYGESETLPKVESMRDEPISPYGLQKMTAERYCKLYHRLYGLPTVALRYFNVFGPRQDPASEYSAVIPKFITCMREGRRATIYGDGEQSRDFTFVDNVVAANLAACVAPERACGEAYNIACADRVTLNELVRLIARISGRPLDADHAAARAGDIRHSLAGIDRAREALGYAPAVDLATGLRRTIDAL